MDKLKTVTKYHLIIIIMDLGRRKFIKTFGVLGGSILLFPACNPLVSAWQFFTEEEAGLIIAVTEQIIPADEYPGATDAGVVFFIDKQLTGFYNNYQQTYRHGLAALQQYSQAQFKMTFEGLEWSIQTEVLKRMENNKLKGDYWKENSPSSFFRLMRDHTMQGFYGSPRHGGNKNYVSYKMLKLDYPAVMGQNRYLHRNSTLNVHEDEK
ncbi:MAG: gluconate 2-dehydrogenase subunit 3 family protein [Draconibacterium sp.]